MQAGLTQAGLTKAGLTKAGLAADGASRIAPRRHEADHMRGARGPLRCKEKV